MISVFNAMLGGLRRSLGMPLVVLTLWIVNLAVALPATVVVGKSLHDSIGSSLVHEKMRDGFDMGWFGEYRATARGFETTFRPELAGVGALYDNIEAWLTGDLFESYPGLLALGLLYVVIWTLLLGGVLSRLARTEDQRGIATFLRSGGRFFWRLLRLALFSAALYFGVYRFHGWAFEQIGEWTRDVTSERTVMLTGLLGYTLTTVLLTLIHNCFGYAKIATVLENRRSMALAALRGIGFVFSHPGSTMGLYYLVLLASSALLVLYGWVAPGPSTSTTLGIAGAFLVGQAMLVAKLVMRLTLLGGQMTLYQGRVRASNAASSSASLGR